MSKPDTYRKFWYSGLHGSNASWDGSLFLVWQLFHVSGETVGSGIVDGGKFPDKIMCDSILEKFEPNEEIKYSLIVLSNWSPVYSVCNRVLRMLVTKHRLFHFQWSFVSLCGVNRSSCVFHNDGYMHRVSPAVSEKNISGLHGMARANIQLSTFTLETWAYLRGFLKLPCVPPSCLGRNYEKTFNHNVFLLKGSMSFKNSRKTEDCNTQADFKDILESQNNS